MGSADSGVVLYSRRLGGRSKRNCPDLMTRGSSQRRFHHSEQCGNANCIDERVYDMSSMLHKQKD